MFKDDDRINDVKSREMFVFIAVKPRNLRLYELTASRDAYIPNTCHGIFPLILFSLVSCRSFSTHEVPQEQSVNVKAGLPF